jgi:hypothetical protein
MIRDALPETSIYPIVNSDRADIIVCTCYGDLTPLTTNLGALRLLFLGENVRPCFTEFDASITFDIGDHMGRNLYFPLCLFEIDLYNRKRPYPDRTVYTKEDFTSLCRQVDLSVRKKALVVVGNNCEPFRMSMISYLRDSGLRVDWYGSQHNPVDDKQQLLSSYRGHLCFENSFTPGYVTEKPMHAYLAGTPSVHWGSDLKYNIISSHSLFYSAKPDAYEMILKKCRELVESEEIIEVKPILELHHIEEYLDSARVFLRRWLGSFL